MDFFLKTIKQLDKPAAKVRKDSEDPWSLEDKGFEIDIPNAWKYNLKELCEHVKNYDNYCNKVKKKYSELLEEYLKLREQDQTAQKDIKKLTDETEYMKKLIEQLNTQITGLTEERDVMNETNEQLKNELQSVLSAKPAAVQVQVEQPATGPVGLEKSTTAKFDELNSAVSSLLQMIETASQEAKEQDFKEQLTNLVSEIDNSLKVMNSSIKELRDGLQEKSQEISKSYKEDVESMKEGISIWQEKVSAMETMNVALKEGAAKNTATINSLQAMIDKLSKANEDLEKETIALKNQVKHSKKGVEGAKAQFEENLRAMREEKDEACKKQLEQLENRLIQERLRYEGKSKDCAKLEDSNKELKAQLHHQLEETKSALRKIEGLEAELKSLKEQLRDQKLKNKTLIDENHDTKTKMEARLRDRENQLDEVTKKLNEVLVAAHAEKPHSSSLSQENELNSVKLLVTELKEGMEKLRLENESLTEKLEELKKTNQDQRRSIQVLQEKRENALQEIKRLTSHLEKSKSRDNIGLESLVSARHITHDSTPVGSKMNESMMGGLGFQQKGHDKPLPTLDDMLLMKMAMEKVYQEFFAKYMPQSGPDENFRSLERKINEAIIKTQDCIDSYDV